MSEKEDSLWHRKKSGEGMNFNFAIPFIMMFLVFLVVFLGKQKATEEIAPVLFAVLSVMALLLSPLWIYLRNRHELNKQKLKADTSAMESKDTGRVKRLEERMENLEALICRLDSELNDQIERSVTMGKVVSPNLPGSSQMPTSFLNIAAALEGRYQILKELGRGGMGVVFQAHDKQLNEQVAIKILSPILSQDPDAMERLKREVSAARRVTHPNVIRIHDISEIQGLQYVSMEFFGGISLKDHIRQRGALSLMQAYQIISQICDGLEAAHLQGVIHRDLKSQNIIISETNQIKLIDFGLARSAHLEGLTATGLIMGTPEYMAPEQVSGKKVDERADIYSLGVILYEIFTGRVPFTGESAIAVGFKQIKDDPPPPHELNPQIPGEVERIILKALEKNPLMRYRTVTELKQELEKAILTRSSSTVVQSSPQPQQVEPVKN